MRSKNLSRDLVLLIAVCLSYGLVLLTNLTILPIFGDEAIYLNWSQTIREDPRQLFIPLSDGKQPMFMWLTALATFLTKNPLVATRLVSVASGLAGAIGIYFIAKALFDRKTAIYAAAVYCVIPIFFFYNRLGVPDGLLTTFCIWLLYAAINLYRGPSVRNTILLAVTIGGGLLTKTPAVFSIALLPLLLLLPVRDDGTSRVRWDKRLLFFIAGLIGGGALFGILKFSPLFAMIRARTGDFVFPASHLLTSPFNPLIGRISLVIGWVLGYVSWPIVGLVIVGIAVGCMRRHRSIFFLFLWFLLPMMVEMDLAKGFTPRYFVFILIPLPIIAGFGLTWLDERLTRLSRFASAILVILFLIPLEFLFLLTINPAKAPIPEKERQGYLEEWTAGYGIAEVSQYIKQMPMTMPILVGTEGHFGTLPDGLIDYNRKSPNIHIEGMGQPAEMYHVPDALYNWLLQYQNGRAFLVVNKSRMHVTDTRRLRLIAPYPKPAGQNGQDALLFYEVSR